MNRYSVLALVLIIMMTMIIGFTPEEKEIELTGYADGINQNENGFTFWIHDVDGDSVKAYSKTPVDDSLHVFKGKYSSDRGIFFVDGTESYAHAVEE